MKLIFQWFFERNRFGSRDVAGGGVRKEARAAPRRRHRDWHRGPVTSPALPSFCSTPVPLPSKGFTCLGRSLFPFSQNGNILNLKVSNWNKSDKKVITKFGKKSIERKKIYYLHWLLWSDFKGPIYLKLPVIVIQSMWSQKAAYKKFNLMFCR